MVARTLTTERLEQRETHMDNALAVMPGLLHEADLRGLSGADVAVSIAAVLAARNGPLAGKVLTAVGDAIRMQPITKIIGAGTLSFNGAITDD